MKLFSSQKNYNLPIYDYSLIWAALLLLGIGLVMVYSASIDVAAGSQKYQYQHYYFLVRQASYLLIAFICGYITFLIPVYIWQRWAPYLFFIGIILLILVLLIGLERNGSQRWLSLGVLNLQPTELVKLFTVMYASDYVLRKSKQMRTIIKGFLPMLGVMIFTGSLVILEPDLGALIVIMAIAMGILFLGGLTLRVILSLAILAPIGVWVAIMSSPYRMKRILAFRDAWSPEHKFDGGYQITQAQMAFGNGEFFGVGVGNSVAKLSFLPEAHTDFLMAIIGEEFGLFGFSIVLGLFAFLIVRMFGIAKESIQNNKHFAALMAQGIALWFAIQCTINIAVNLGLFPTKGLTLPLLSFGGSSILVSIVAIAIVLRIDHENRRNLRGQHYNK
ncbi:putative lipid II flippase FtsW [Methylophilaceae bacterium]|nr:putative lipid II flippase FtsW [Methylophilaceae bacterium]|tara:strand:- start:7096 stop:8262 length:1167 start_codon:yes stop_codon:yes gene_type:complete